MNNQICPWDILKPSHINFCEAKLCSLIVKPAETWSNISFVIVGILVIYLSKKENQKQLSPIGYIGIVLGLFSGFFHASGTSLGSWLDISSMYLLTGVAIAYNFKRLYGWAFMPTFLALVIPSSLIVYFFEVLGLLVFALHFITALAVELVLYRKKQTDTDYKPLLWMLGIFLVAWSVWWLDLTKVWCDPDNHYFSGHALWHLMTGTTFYFIYRFYRQFK